MAPLLARPFLIGSPCSSNSIVGDSNPPLLVGDIGSSRDMISPAAIGLRAAPLTLSLDKCEPAISTEDVSSRIGDGIARLAENIEDVEESGVGELREG